MKRAALTRAAPRLLEEERQALHKRAVARAVNQEIRGRRPGQPIWGTRTRRQIKQLASFNRPTTGTPAGPQERARGG